tara:strand:+ start:1690 stop:1917 length:228 start_codon:yes stop_codon:yes gene_type:complete
MESLNTWDYRPGDLIRVEKRGWPWEIGVVTAFRPQSEGVPRNYWEWVGTSGRTQFFFQVASPLQEDFKIKVLARA